MICVVGGNDYEALSERLLTFGPASTRFDVTVNISNDNIFEVTEYFSASLTLSSQPVERIAVDPDNTDITIFDDDGNNIQI